MKPSEFLALAEETINGYRVTQQDLKDLITAPSSQLPYLMAGASLIRERHFGSGIHLCAIQNAKSGRCTEDCAFCSQSLYANTDAPIYGFVGKEEIVQNIQSLPQYIHRFSVVTSGRRLKRSDVEELAKAFLEAKKGNVRLCASLGSLNKEDLFLLKEAGLSRYHHNLETAPSHFPNICTTHTFEERVNTLRAAKELGLEICSGGIFGMGETDEQVVEFALTLRELDVDAVPTNFLTPIKGTRLGDLNGPEPMRCLRIISVLRYTLPSKDIIICGGREQNLRELHPLVFYAGASGIMTGNYLTTKGRNYEQDIALLKTLNLTPRGL